MTRILRMIFSENRFPLFGISGQAAVGWRYAIAAIDLLRLRRRASVSSWRRSVSASVRALSVRQQAARARGASGSAAVQDEMPPTITPAISTISNRTNKGSEAVNIGGCPAKGSSEIVTGARFATANSTISERDGEKDEHRDDLADHGVTSVSFREALALANGGGGHPVD